MSTSADSEDWTLAESFLSQVLDLFNEPAPGNVWRVVVCLVNQGRIKKAAKLISKYRPAVRDRDEAELWFRAHASLRWDERTAVEAFGLAERFMDDPELSTALLGHIVFNTHGIEEATDEPPVLESDERHDDPEEFDDEELEKRRALAQSAVPGELHRRAFELIDQLFKRHGERTGIKVLKAEDEEELMEQLLAQLKRDASSQEALDDLITQTRHGQMPLGFLAGALHRGYATAVLQRALGFLFASSPDQDEHDAEVALARATFDHSIVMDVSAVVTLSGLDHPGDLTGRFVAQNVPPAAMLDLHRASLDVRGLAGSPGSIRWDPDRESVTINDLDDQEFRRLLVRAERVDTYTDRLSVRVVGQRTLVANLGERPEQRAWTDALELAAQLGQAVWSDDLGFRRLARQCGIPAFGTPAVVDAIRDLSLEASITVESDRRLIEHAAEIHRALARDCLVDLPLTPPDILAIAEAEEWQPRSGAIAVSRPAWWAAYPDGITILGDLYERARSHGTMLLDGWQYAFMLGIARAVPPETASGLLALIALRGFDEGTSDQERAEGVVRARQVAAQVGCPDPSAALLPAANMLAEDGACDDAEALAARVYKLAEALNSEKRSRRSKETESGR